MYRYGTALGRDSRHSKEDKALFLELFLDVNEQEADIVLVGSEEKPGGAGSLAKVAQGSDTCGRTGKNVQVKILALCANVGHTWLAGEACRRTVRDD